jgi:hypothetical protein
MSDDIILTAQMSPGSLLDLNKNKYDHYKQLMKLKEELKKNGM